MKMYFHFFCILYFTGLIPVNNGVRAINNYTYSKDINLTNWDNSTLLSLKNHIQSTKDSAERKAYQNRLEAFKALQKIDKKDGTNGKSIRYKFLKEFASNNLIMNDTFYIIEANHSGELVGLNIYVIFPRAANETDIVVYNYVKREWTKSNTTIKMPVHINDKFKAFTTKFGLGFNQDDVIITMFVNSEVKNSEYFLYRTISTASPFKAILSRLSEHP